MADRLSASATPHARINRNQKIEFRFDGQRLTGHPGDTLASALLANGQMLVGRSFKYHRPRGIFSAGSEEPNALVELRRCARKEPNTRATTAELFDGLEANSQNYRGSLRLDLMAISDVLSPFLGAGFYYKTFMWPRSFWEKLYEPAIRAAAGLGRLSAEADPDSYDKGFLHCDVLVIGAGPAGLSAALTAGRAGARVILADEDFELGGRLLTERREIDGRPGGDWARLAVAELEALENVRLLARTTVYGAYDHGIYGALERKTDHLLDSGGKPRQVLWRIYSRQAILCAGSTERPIAFGNNDRPGVMLAGAVRAYANRWATAAGQRVAVFTNNDDGWRTAHDLVDYGVEVAAVIDTRKEVSVEGPTGVRCLTDARVVDTKGRLGLKSVRLADGQVVQADCLSVSGGWNPNVHLTCHQRGRPTWRDDIAAFVPGEGLPVGMTVAGAARGHLTLAAALADGKAAASDVTEQLGYEVRDDTLPMTDDEPREISAFWHVPESKGRTWIDQQNDVTVKDIALSQQEGFHAVEHLKRYTTLGMTTDQGKTSNVIGLAIMAELTGKSIIETGTTVFRPPYTPVPLSALAGRARGKNYRPTRLTPAHGWAEEMGASLTEAGQWLRAEFFPQHGERHWRESVNREVLQTRSAVGVCDVSTLGKIDVQGADAAEYLDRIYANTMATLKVGRARYGLMLREDGVVMDDGTAARLTETHFVVTTTTANASPVFQHMQFCRQCLWPELDVHLVPVTDQWAQFGIAGPKARTLLEAIIDADTDISNEAFPFMACGEIGVCGGVRARLFRISFSGELAYEIAVPGRFGHALIKALMKAGEPHGVVAYGLEALSVMRLEKGHPIVSELDGRVTAREAGLGKMVSQKKDCIGNVLCRREAMTEESGLKMMGFRPVNRSDPLTAGAHFIPNGSEATLDNDEGYMTSVGYSPNLGHHIGLGFIKRGGERLGETVRAIDQVRDREVEVEIVSPHFYDPDGTRLRG